MGNGTYEELSGGNSPFAERLRRAELRLERDSTRLDNVEDDAKDFKSVVRADLTEIKASQRDLRVGQRNLVMGLLAAAITFAGAAVPLILLLAQR